MSHEPDAPGTAGSDFERPVPRPPVTAADNTQDAPGAAAVAEVLASLEGLEGRPVSEHVAVFEAAHESLRATLSGGGDRTAG